MKGVHAALALSVLLNIGVLAGAGYVYWRQPASPPALPDYLGLSEMQRREWAAAEAGFADALSQAAARTAAHRERMVRAIFAEPPQREAIEAERRAIAEVQQQQQQRVIDQLLREARLLDAGQRTRLADLLLRELGPASPDVERLHRR